MKKKTMGKISLNVLYLENSPQDVGIIRELLTEAGYDLSMDCAEKKKEFDSLLRSRTYDVILSGFNVPGFDAFGALRLSIKICPDVPFICIAGSIGEETAIELIKQGAIDYILQDRPARLPSAIKRALDEVKGKNARRQEEAALRESEKRYHFLFESSIDAVLLASTAGNIYSANPAACKMFGRSEAGICALGRNGIVDVSDRRLPLALEERDRTGRYIGERMLLRSDGSKFPAEITEAIIKDTDGCVRSSMIIRDISDRKRAEEAFHKSEFLFRLLFEQNLVGVYHTTLEGDVLDCNDAFINMLGYDSLEEIRAHKAADFYSSETARNDFVSCLRTEGFVKNSEISLSKKNGTTLFGLENVTLIAGVENTPSTILGTIVDITERKRTEDALKKSTQVLRDAGEMAKVGGWELDLSTKEISWTEEVYRIHGVEPGYQPKLEEILSFYAPESRAALEEALKKAMETGESFDIESLLIPSGSKDKIWVRSLGRAVYSGGKIVKLSGTFQNIDKHIKVEEELRASEAVYRSILNSAINAIVPADSSGSIVVWNKSAERMFGYSYAEAIGQPINYLIPQRYHGEGIYGLFKRQSSEKNQMTDRTIEMEGLRKDGSEFSLEVSLAEWEISGDWFYTCIIHDITERKQREEEQAYQTRLHKFRSEISYSLNRQLSLREILQQSAEVIIRNFDIACAQIWTMNRGINSLELQAHAELSTLCIESDECIHIGNLLVSRVVAERHTIVNNSIPDEPLLVDTEWLRQHKIIAYAGLPLFVENHFVGVLTVFAGTLLLERTLEPLAGSADILAQGIMRKLTELMSKQTEENFRRSMEDSPLGVRIITAEGDTIYANRAILDIYGYDNLEELKKTPIKDRYTPASYAEFKIRKEKRERGEFGPSEYEIGIVRKNGDVRYVHVFRKEAFWNGEKQYQALYRDITERKRSKEALRETESKYHELFTLMRLMSDTMPDLLWAKDLNKQFIFANKAHCEKLLHAADTAEPIGKTDLFFAQRERDLHPENPTWHTFGEVCMDSDAITIKEMREMQFDEYGNVQGRYLYLDVHKAPLFTNEGKLIGVVGSARDITERKHAEEELKNVKDSLEQFSQHLVEAIEGERARISRELHDELGQSLTALKIDLNWMHDHPSLKNESETKLVRMIDIVNRTIREVQTIASELRPNILEDLGLVPAIEWYCEEFEKRTGIRCETDLEDIYSQNMQLSLTLFRVTQEALTNIVRHANATTVKVKIHPTKKGITLEIIDNGIGIDENKISSNKSLGIIGMRERVRQCGGRLEITSLQPKGTSVSVLVQS